MALLIRVPLLATILLTSPPLSTATYAALRTWTDSSGKFTVEAEYVGKSGDTIHLKRANGKLIRIKLDQLSRSDTGYLRNLWRQESSSQQTSKHKKQRKVVIPDSLAPVQKRIEAARESAKAQIQAIKARQKKELNSAPFPADQAKIDAAKEHLAKLRDLASTIGKPKEDKNGYSVTVFTSTTKTNPDGTVERMSIGIDDAKRRLGKAEKQVQLAEKTARRRLAESFNHREEKKACDDLMRLVRDAEKFLEDSAVEISRLEEEGQSITKSLDRITSRANLLLKAIALRQKQLKQGRHQSR